MSWLPDGVPILYPDGIPLYGPPTPVLTWQQRAAYADAHPDEYPFRERMKKRLARKGNS